MSKREIPEDLAASAYDAAMWVISTKNSRDKLLKIKREAHAAFRKKKTDETADAYELARYDLEEAKEDYKNAIEDHKFAVRACR